jgi:uncharacterized protein (TIGR03086 family)
MNSYAVLVDAEHRLTTLIQTLSPTDLDRPTPCADWDVRKLLSHTLAGIEIFASTIDGASSPTAEQMFNGTDLLDNDAIAATTRATTRSQTAWANLTNPDQELTTILGPLPAHQMLAISAFATVVHGWDIAIATNQPITELPADLLAHAETVAHQIVPAHRATDGEHGLFQPESPTPPDATPTQRFMAYLGRTV